MAQHLRMLAQGRCPPADNFLHEAALVRDPPSGIKYDPEQSRDVLTHSLAVHERWNDPQEKKYSRNLGKKEGIELVALSADNGKGPHGTSE